MTISELYISKQEHKVWVDKFQSTGNHKSGKIFAYTNTNFRSINSFLSQIAMFKDINGKSRSQWRVMSRSGQELDKHRITSLINAGWIESDNERYYLTNSGSLALRLNNAKLTSFEKWPLLFFLLQNYSFEGNKREIYVTTNRTVENLHRFNLDTDFLISNMSRIVQKKSDLYDVFKEDVFWIVSFLKDTSFVKSYLDSPQIEKDELFSYVINEHKKKKSTDLVAHKFVSSGAYSKTMLFDEWTVLCTEIMTSGDVSNGADIYLNSILNAYTLFFDKIRKPLIIDFFEKNHDSFIDCFKKIKAGEI